MKKTIIRTHACLALMCGCVQITQNADAQEIAQQVRAYVESDLVHTGFETSDQLRAQLQSHMFTRLSLHLPGGMQTFRIRASRNIKSADPQSAFYEGVATDGNHEHINIVIHNGKTLITYRNELTGAHLLLAKTEELAKAGWLPLQREDFVTEPGNYAWIQNADITSPADQTEMTESLISEVEVTASQDERTAKTTAAGDVITYPWWRTLGWIGKRDFSITVYNYNKSLSDIELMNTTENLMYSLRTFQDHEININFIVSLTPPFTPTTATLPFNTDVASFLTSFHNMVIAKTASYGATYGDVYKTHSYPMANNEFHFLLQKGFAWKGSKGKADAGGCYGVAAINGLPEDPNPCAILGINFSALPTSTCMSDYWNPSARDVMYAGTATCPQILYHTPANRSLIANRMNAITYVDEVPANATVSLSAASTVMYSTTVDTRDVMIQYISPYWTAATRVKSTLFHGQVNLVDYAPDGTPLFMTSTYNDRLAVYKVRFPATGRYTIRTNQLAPGIWYDTYLYILNPDGDLIARDDDSGGDQYSLVSGYFDSDYYYVIVGGYGNNGVNCNLKISKYTGTERTTGEGTSLDLDMGNGNIIYTADFGVSQKSKVQPQHPVLASGELARVFPNPVASGQRVTLYTGTASRKEYAIYNTMGVRVMNGSVEAASAEISLQGLASGNYMIRVADADGRSSVQHIVVQ